MPPWTLATTQPAWVHTAVNALMSPAVGWVPPEVKKRLKEEARRKAAEAKSEAGGEADGKENA